MRARHLYVLAMIMSVVAVGVSLAVLDQLVEVAQELEMLKLRVQLQQLHLELPSLPSPPRPGASHDKRWSDV